MHCSIVIFHPVIKATLKIYMEQSVGIGEHPQHIDECDKLVEKIANAKEKLEVLKEFEPEKL